jgi:hypothetical protein
MEYLQHLTKNMEHSLISFKNAFMQLSSIREYSNNGDLLKDSLKLLKKHNELSNSSTLFNNRLPISKFFEQITSSEDNTLIKITLIIKIILINQHC